MKIIKLHEYYSINIFIYLIFFHALSVHSMFNFWIGSNYDYLWIPFLPIFIITSYLIPINIFFICLEFLFRKLKLIKSENEITLSNKALKIIYSLLILACVYIVWFWIYYYPILEKQLQFD